MYFTCRLQKSLLTTITQRARQYLTACALMAKWLKSEQQVKQLEHTVNILGTTEDDNYFTINIDPPAQNGNYIDKIFGGWLEVCSCAERLTKNLRISRMEPIIKC